MDASATNGRCLLCPHLPPMTGDDLLDHLAGEHQLPPPAEPVGPGPRVHEVVWVPMRGTAS